MKPALLLTLLAVLAFGRARSEDPPPPPPSTHERLVREFVAAFNRRDLDGLLARTTDDVQWLALDGARVHVETAGREALGASLEKYFAACPSCRSELEWVRDAGERVAALERAEWTSGTRPSAQRSLSVYEFDGERIARVLYFPAERVALASSVPALPK